MGSKQVPTSQIGTVGEKHRLSTREVPSQYADFIKSDILVSQKSPKPSGGGEISLEQNQLKLIDLENPIKGSKQKPTSLISLGTQEGWSSNREIPSQYTDFNKSGNLES